MISSMSTFAHVNMVSNTPGINNHGILMMMDVVEKYWLPVEPLTRDSRVCKSCVNKMATTILVQEMFSKLPSMYQIVVVM